MDETQGPKYKLFMVHGDAFPNCFFQAPDEKMALRIFKTALLEPEAFMQARKVKVTEVTTLEQLLGLLPEEFIPTAVEF